MDVAGEVSLAKAALAALNDPNVTAAVREAVNAQDEAGLAAQAAQADFADCQSRLDALLLDSSDESLDDDLPSSSSSVTTGAAFTSFAAPLVSVDRAVAVCRQAMAAAVAEQGGDGWSLQTQLLLPPRDDSESGAEPSLCHVRAVRDGDEEALLEFGLRGLSDASRATFAPYEWQGPIADLRAQLKAAVDNSLRRQDLHLIAIADGHAPAVPDPSDMRGRVVCHVFLWSAADEIPELGLAVADAWHGRGLGQAALLLMEAVARAHERAALELTTMQGNERAFRCYGSLPTVPLPALAEALFLSPCMPQLSLFHSVAHLSFSCAQSARGMSIWG